MFPCLFARRMEACVRSGKFTLQDTAAVAAKAYHNANRNPLAHMHAVKVSLEDASSEEKLFLANPTYKPYLRLTDCSQVSDGGAGLILASEEGLRRHGLSPSDPSLLEVLAVRLATGNLYDDNRTTLTRMPTSHAAAQQALTAAGVTAAQIEVAEVHDCFTPAELLMYEALGLCQEGEGAAYFHSGATTLDGKVPVNTGGGLVAFGHPVGATGIKQVMEVYRQMKGKCGAYQMKHTPAIGVTLNMGGDDKTAVSTVLKNI
ncbi:acetyl-CoA acyltransferase [Angomonas deanei]|uniref:propanoyl-CoA C-acyltransferase n=1 Tax=Angomonas deanei TaxID=59799 RepID=A0A7G2CP03_9TRYP|nr:acetyl-CoA acyltransferase [Angomonas deanei]CAD2220684.1 Thiolase, C-terminal domain containing protein, putative [Angomonas deanei]|eukprot:EPY36227.1 acetyl-CoA acyltransferase [Angomonas deanei]